MRTQSTSSPQPSTEGVRTLLERLFRQVYSNGELSVADDVVAPEFVGRTSETDDPFHGPGGVKSHASRLRAAFHGFTVELDDVDVAGDVFEATWTATGTHERRFLGIEPALSVGAAGVEPHGTRVAVSGSATGRVGDGTIRTCRLEWDVTALRRQLGAPADRDDVDVATRPAADVPEFAPESQAVQPSEPGIR